MRALRPVAAMVLALCLAPPTPLRAEGQPPDPVADALAALQTDRLRPLDFAPFHDALAALRPDPDLATFLRTADIPAIAAALDAGHVTSEAITLWHLDRIRRHDDRLRGMLELNPAALDEARAADARRAAGRALGPLDGVPVSLKDNIETAPPLHTTANAAVLRDHVAAGDAPLVANLRAAGAVIIGKASLSEFAGVVARGFPSGGNGAVGGQGVNPLGPYPTQGSSSGSAIGVAAGYAIASVGTETSGSLIAPAEAASLVAMKPSAGLVSGAGIIPLLRNNDSAGPVARSVRDAAILLLVIDTADTDYTAGLSLTALDGVRAGIATGSLAQAADHAQVLSRAGVALALLGADTHPVTLADPTGLVDAFPVLLASGIRFDMMPYVTAHAPALRTPEDLIAWAAADPARRAPFGQDLLVLLAPLAAGLTAADHADAAAAMTAAATAALQAAFAEGGGSDVLVSLSSFHAPYYATAGFPAITVPMGRSDTGAPAGITLIGRAGQDARLLAMAHALEQMTRARLVADLP